MKIIDHKGRFLGKVNILDLGAILITILVFLGIFVVPGPTGSIAQISSEQGIEVDVLVRGLGISNLEGFLASFEQNKRASIIVRTQAAGTVEVKNVEVLPRTMGVPQPDGSVKALPDPRPEVSMIQDLNFTIVGQGQVTGDGAVLGQQKIKIGTSIELDGPNYNFRGTVVDVRN